MSLDIYKAILHTSGKTPEQIREQAEKEKWVGTLSDKDIDDMIKYWNQLDGLEVLVGEGLSEDYALVYWNPEDDEKVMEAMYLAEQDPIFGNYINDKDGFKEAWKNGEYEPGGTFSIAKEDVEIIEKMAG